MNVHASRKPFVEVDGRVFSGVTGLPPHYYNVDSIHKVIFATSDAPRYATTIIYVVDSESGEMIQIPTTGAFGEYLGVPIAVSPDYQDFVSKATPGAVEFTAFRGSEKYVFTIDLITRQVVDAHAEPLSRMEIDSHAREKKK
ncbi:MAG: hypothetical protein JNL50_05850 [Phycisphaerae bacterium]|nr:hypothetical protein [Phycisphaerae bacterium]